MVKDVQVRRTGIKPQGRKKLGGTEEGVDSDEAAERANRFGLEFTLRI